MTFKMTKLLTTSLVVLMLGATGAHAQDAATSSSTDTTTQSTTQTTDQTSTTTKPAVHHYRHRHHHNAAMHQTAAQTTTTDRHLHPIRQTSVRTTKVMATHVASNDMNGMVEVVHHPYVDDSWSVLHGMNDHTARWFFYQADRNHDGELDFGEFEHMVAWKYPAGDIRPSKKFAAMDENQDGVITYQEFMRNYKKPYTQELPIHWVPNGARGDNDDE